MLCVAFSYFRADDKHAECCYAECYYGECRCTKCRNAESCGVYESAALLCFFINLHQGARTVKLFTVVINFTPK
jgi:hypothetical protein